MSVSVNRLWTLQSASMPEARARGAAVQVDDNVYVIAGNNGAVVSNVMRAKIGAGGIIRDWAMDRPLPAAMSLPGTGFSANGYVYYAGGLPAAGTPSLATVYAAKVGPGGGLEAWQTLALPIDGAQMDFIVVDRWLYMFGAGHTPSAVVDASVYVTDLRGDGSFGPWRQLQNYPEGSVIQSRSVYYGGYIYTALGYSGGASPTFYNTIWSAQVFGDGSLGRWQAVGSFPVGGSQSTGRIRSASFLVGDLWVITGGAQVNIGTTPVGTTWTVRLGGGGQVLGPAVDVGSPLAIPVYTPFTAQSDRFLFVMGGNDSSTTRTQAVQSVELDR